MNENETLLKITMKVNGHVTMKHDDDEGLRTFFCWLRIFWWKFDGN